MRERQAPTPAAAPATQVRAPAEQRRGPTPLTGAGLVGHLQAAAGNRAVASMLAGRTVQRHIGPTLSSDLGLEPGTGTGTPGGLDYAALAVQIRDAVEGLGTDEDAVYAALGRCERDPAKVEALGRAYVALTGRTLLEDIEDDFSGDELDRALRLMRPPDRREQIEAQMRTTASGLWALGVIADHEVAVEWEYTGTGSFHSSGTIYLNRSLPVNAAAITMMHEAQHALTFKTGRAADRESMTRDAFVTAKIADEAEAVVRAIEGAAPMAAAGTSIAGSGLTASLITQYETALTAEAARLRAADAALAETEARRRARTTVRNGLVTNWFHDGTFVTSTGNITYSEHYGRQWDAVHQPPTANPAPMEAE